VERYQDLSGGSGVAAYRIGHDSIVVRFKTGHGYLYTYASTGRSNVERMKLLAARGEGLATFINQHVGKRYARKVA
jgi:hypothetical protein